MPSNNTPQLSFEPPSQQLIYEKTILFQQRLQETFQFDHCDICSKKVTKPEKLTSVLLSDPRMKVLESNERQSVQPTILCPVSLRWFYLHRLRFEKASFLPIVSSCSVCYEDLSDYKLPKFSIANMIFAEPLPSQLKDMSLAENLMISKVYKRSVIWQSGDDKHSALNQHILTFDNDLNNFTTILPRPPTEISSLLKIIFLKDTEEEQVLPKVGLVRREVVIKALKWLQENNPNYRDVTVREENLNVDEYHTEVEYAQRANNLCNIISPHVNFEIREEHFNTEIGNGTTIERTSTAGLYQVQTTTEDKPSFQIKGRSTIGSIMHQMV
jgi:hypothetical protein